MEIASKYNPQEVEGKWYDYWLKNRIFNSVPDDREPFTIVIPPPNVTGVLHMGHMLNNTIQDVLVRRARMKGLNACWVPGTDHASIATEAKVVAKLREEGVSKTDLSREGFLKHAWDWTEKHGGIILEQLKKLGASCDWDRTKFTMDDDLSKSVIKVFVDLYNKGKIYRGIRMVNWDPEAKTTVSDEEVIYKEVQSHLYHIKYKIEGEDGYVTIATTRPETILGDSAVCVNPNDVRFQKLAGKKVIVPLIGRVIPIIQDEYVDMEFGTGCLKITPAHDINDYEIGLKHNLEVIDIFNDNGTLNENAQLFIGEDRFKVRKEITKELEKSGNLAKIEDYVNKVGFSERTSAVIEPKISMQWFLAMKDISKPALENVLNDTIQLHPAKFKNTYRHWMENVKDWCISRQLWWGHRIPAYYLPNSNEFVVAESGEQALEMAKQKTGNNNLQLHDLRQDEDVLDTWFSSWLWPITVFNGIIEPNNLDYKYYYPTNDLVTGPDILFFWVARMIIAGYEYNGKHPFKNVYLTGMVRDKQRRKMSKSLGNSPDPLDLIAKYGADGVRVGMLLCAPAGNDLLFDEALTEQGQKFASKIWSALRLVKGWEVSSEVNQPEHAKFGLQWFEDKLNEVGTKLNEQYEQYRLSEALMALYKLFWDDFCSWLLEIVKPEYQKPIDAKTYEKTVELFEKLLLVLHPFMPFITEEIWHSLKNRNDGDSIAIELVPQFSNSNTELTNNFEDAKEITSAIRTIRKEKNIPYKEQLELFVAKGSGIDPNLFTIIIKLTNLSSIQFTESKIENALSFRVKSDEFYIPLNEQIDVEEELHKLKDELEHAKGFLKIVNKKLSNEKFVNGAPENVVALEKKKQADAIEKIKTIEDRITELS